MTESDDIYPPDRSSPLHRTETESGEGWQKSNVKDIFQSNETSVSVDGTEQSSDSTNPSPKYFEEVAKFEDYGQSKLKLEDRNGAVAAPPEEQPDPPQTKGIVKLPAVPKGARTPNRQNPAYLPTNIAKVTPAQPQVSKHTPDKKDNHRESLFFVSAAISLTLGLFGFLYLSVPSDVSLPPPRDGTSSAPQRQLSTATERVSGPLASEALEKAKGPIDGSFDTENIIRRLIENKQMKPARQLSIVAMAKHGVTDTRAALYNRTIASDEQLGVGVMNLENEFTFDLIEDLSGGSLYSFKLINKDRPAYSFKPAQGEWRHSWRGEVAAYRFCEMIACHFKVPRNWPVRISKSEFLRHYAGELDQSQINNLRWIRLQTADGETEQFLYGALERWIPSFASWPIEYTDIWQPWLSVHSPNEALDLPLKLNLQPLKYRDSRAFYRHIVQQAPTEQKTRKIARQLSSLLVFDYITTNWDRFSPKRKFFGTNNQYADGTFVSIDNGAAFSPFPSDRLNSRIERVSRFSRQTIASLKAIDLQAIDDKLLPPIPEIDDRRNRRLSIFWEQRAKFLQRVDRLISEHGEDNVLIFR